MDIIEVDPKLFVTCRLCLEDLGQYQIVPSIQQQIKFCFDFEVEPFDGLPQLICLKCKEILSKFNTVKSTFCEKQTNLKSKVFKKDEICIQPQQDTVSSSQQPPENVDDLLTENVTKKKKTKKKRVIESSCTDSASEQSFQVNKPKKKKSPKHDVDSPMPFEKAYKKQVVCKLCNSLWPTKRSFWNHVRSHDLLKAKFKNIFSRKSTVNLNKIDDKPNITGMSTMVVHSSNKIIAPGNSYFHTIYLKENNSVANTSSLDDTELKNEYKQSISQDSTDDDEIQIPATRRKRRLSSRSSSDTVVIASNNNKILSDNEEESKIETHDDNIDEHLSYDHCINIDSSDSETDQGKLDSSQRIKQRMEANHNDFKVIQGIITMCVNSYHKKNESADINVTQVKNKEISSESQLKHKVLSIGRKVINKQGFNCTGLLRYLEHKNLEIMWNAKGLTCNNYIRVLTKLRGHGNTDDDDIGWDNVPEISESNSFKSVPVIQVAASNKLLSSALLSGDSVHNTTSANIATSQHGEIETSNLHLNNQTDLDTMPALLVFDSRSSTSDSKKLLNANPVANPKQLPKKLGSSNETRSNKTVTQQSISHTNNDDVNYCMPIITSTTSLATVAAVEDNQDCNQNKSIPSGVITNTETAAPRIKVKPVSELMSERTLNSLMIEQQGAPVTNNNMLVSQVENVWPHQQPMNVFVPNMNIVPQMHVTSPQLQIVQVCPNQTTTYQVMPSPTTSNTKQDYVILDTTDFPNTKTDKPFKYLKDLLQMHNLFLLDPCETLSRDFVCLIRFKVLFKQDPCKEPPLVLCLSIFCLKNAFCLKVRDRNQDNIDINKISANWQWEILQIYRGNVVAKVLQNAQKISQETFDFTNKFFCLLKSINCRKV